MYTVYCYIPLSPNSLIEQFIEFTRNIMVHIHCSIFKNHL